MRKRLVWVNFMLIFCVNTAHASLPPDTYWQCTVTDSAKQPWIARHIYQQIASNNAFDLCKKNSPQPLSCKLPPEGCESFTHGESNRPLWQCTALDQKATPWIGARFPNRDAAAIAAKNNCLAHSRKADSCYVNLIACKDIHAKD